MRLKNKRRWQIMKTYITGWTVAFIILSVIRGVGTIEEALETQYSFISSVMLSFILGPVFGFFSGMVQILVEERIYKRMPIRSLLLIKFAYTIVFMMTLVTAGYGISKLFLGVNQDFAGFAFDAGSLAIYFYIVMVEIFMTILNEIKLMFGGNKLAQLLLGKFYSPGEESRIFMFLDLRSSTSIAEKLGHIRYSKLIQDCFNDLGVVAENDADIYQYAGDEAILTWKLEEGVKNQNCMKAFFNFKNQLNKKKSDYLRKYDCMPAFKAGLHHGVVTVTEVGKYKKEIAFHGDAINTASRIQSKCNEYDESLLLSDDLLQKLDDKGFDINLIGDVALRGKEEKLTIYAVRELQTAVEDRESFGGKRISNFN